MSAWTLHHITALCSDCTWTKQGASEWDATNVVLAAARSHARKNSHYVQVERGQHAHYDERPATEAPS